jgi:hypothetical protein
MFFAPKLNPQTINPRAGQQTVEVHKLPALSADRLFKTNRDWCAGETGYYPVLLRWAIATFVLLY